MKIKSVLGKTKVKLYRRGEEKGSMEIKSEKTYVKLEKQEPTGTNIWSKMMLQ